MAAVIPFAAGLFLVALAGYVGVLAFREIALVRLARAAAALESELLRQRINEIADRRRRELEKTERTWDGFRKFVIARKEMEAKDVCSFYLEPHDRRPLPSFLPGQYLTFRLAVPGQPRPVIRCYSLSESPKPDHFRVTIKRIGPPPGNPSGAPGVGSSFFHRELDPGDIVDVKAPSGQFHLEPSDAAPVVLIAGGIGLTPLLCMLNAVVEANARREVWLFYGVRNKTEHAMADHLRRVAAENSNIQVHVCYSDPTPEDRAGEDYRHAERVGMDLLKKVLPSNAPHFYLCGPPPMMQALVEGLHAWGVPHDRVHHEAFGPASVKSAGAHPAADAASRRIEVAFARSGKTGIWDGRSSLLETADALGVKIDFGCRAGNCGTCLTAIKSGEVEYLNPPGAAVEAGSCLACVAVPKTNIRIDA